MEFSKRSGVKRSKYVDRGTGRDVRLEVDVISDHGLNNRRDRSSALHGRDLKRHHAHDREDAGSLTFAASS